jgi:predicted Rossmann-fold nucleotide-binding protein
MSLNEARKTGPVLGIFASDRGPGDPERASLMTQAGTLFARRGARLICLWEGNSGPLPLMAAALAAGGEVSILADSDVRLPPGLSGVPVRVIADRSERHAALASSAALLVALPGSVATAASLFSTWSRPGMALPVVMLNRHRAYEAVRGFASDVLVHAVSGYDRKMQFAENVDELWSKITWTLDQQR